MRAQPSRAKLSYQDFLGFPDDGQRHELIDGEHYVSPSPFTRHQQISKRLFLALNGHLDPTGAGEVFYAPFDVVLSFFDVVEPDLLVVLDAQRQIVTDKHVQGAPAIVVEIVSKSTRHLDEDQKRRLYSKSGVREYWLVDPDTSSVTVHTAEAVRRVSVRLSRPDGAIAISSVLPEFIIDLKALFD